MKLAGARWKWRSTNVTSQLQHWLAVRTPVVNTGCGGPVSFLGSARELRWFAHRRRLPIDLLGAGHRATIRAVALVGRHREQQALAELLDAARRGHSGVLVLRGEPGIGKTALLQDLVERATDSRVLQLSGAELERDMAYAGVQQLCAPLMGLVDGLPGPQADALKVALGLASGAPPDRLLVGLALLTLLGAASGSTPILCVVDDVQWVDSSSVQALAFVARRIQVDPVVMVFTSRDPGADALVGHRELILGGLTDRDARLLLATMVPARLDERVRETVLAEANGNPLALQELHKALTPEGLAGGYGLPSATSTGTHIERTFIQQARELPSATRTLLVVMAAEPAGRPEWIWSALGQPWESAAEAAEPAEAAGLIVVDGGPRFRHPLIRAAIYRSLLGVAAAASARCPRRRASPGRRLMIIGPGTVPTRPTHLTRTSPTS